jgi:hypothetical protein
MGFTLIMLTFIPLLRFILGVLNPASPPKIFRGLRRTGWIIQVFEAVLAAPLMSLSLLATGGEGFMTQQFTTDMWMLVGVILRPMLMAIGMVVSLSAFNNIMQIVNAIFAPAVTGMTDPSDNSLLTLGVYIAIYTSLAYTLANSAFKLIDMLPNWVMNWIGARLEARVDDASAIQQMSQGYVQNLAFSNRADQVDLGNKKERAGMNQEMFQQAEQSAKLREAAGKGNGSINQDDLNRAKTNVEAEHNIKMKN